MRLRLCVPALLLACTASILVADEFPQPYNSEKGNPAPISPEEALGKLTLPPGFKL